MDRTGGLTDGESANLTEKERLFAEARRRQRETGSYVTYDTDNLSVQAERHAPVSSGNAGFVQTDLAELAAVESGLDELMRELAGHFKTAQRLGVLAQDLRDGSGPISDNMRALFTHRAGNAEGMVGTLRGYHQALAGLRDAIHDSRTTYDRAETHNRQTILDVERGREP